MARRRPIFLRRSIANEERRRAQARAEAGAAGAAFRWAAIGVALVIGLGVMVGFTGHGEALAEKLGSLGFLGTPVFGRMTLLEVIAIVLVAISALIIYLRDLRRARR